MVLTAEQLITLTPIDFGLQVARGLISGVSGISKFGRAPSGIQTTATDFWSRADATPTQQIWLAPTAARIHAVVSTSATDAAAGTGARTVQISGLKTWASAETSETVTLNGTTAVNTVEAYVIIHRMQVVTSGSASINAGTISATAATDATVTSIISIGQGQTQMAIYGVPSTQTLYMTRFYGHMNDSSSTARIDVQIRLNTNPDVQTLNFINKRDIQLSHSGTSSNSTLVSVPIKFAGPCIMKIQGIANVTDVDASAGFDGYLVNN